MKLIDDVYIEIESISDFVVFVVITTDDTVILRKIISIDEPNKQIFSAYLNKQAQDNLFIIDIIYGEELPESIKHSAIPITDEEMRIIYATLACRLLSDD